MYIMVYRTHNEEGRPPSKRTLLFVSLILENAGANVDIKDEASSITVKEIQSKYEHGRTVIGKPDARASVGSVALKIILSDITCG